MWYGHLMNNYSKRSFKGGYKGGRDASRPVSMHSATCGSCGKDCEVPFRPTGDRPVYCKNCFDSKEHMAPRTTRSTAREGGADVSKQLEKISLKLEEILSLLQK